MTPRTSCSVASQSTSLRSLRSPMSAIAGPTVRSAPCSMAQGFRQRRSTCRWLRSIPSRRKRKARAWRKGRNSAMRRRAIGLRWWMIGLIMLGALVNFLSRRRSPSPRPRSSPACTSPTQQYGWITGAFQGGIMLQPVVGYVIDMMGVKIGLRAVCLRWSVICMAHGLAGSWQMLAGLRGLLGFAEGSAYPGRHEGDIGMVSRQGARLGRRHLTISGRRWARCWRRRWSPGRSSNYNWQASFVIVGADQPGLGRAVAALLSSRPQASRAVGRGTRATSSGQEAILQADGQEAFHPVDPDAAQFLGHRAAALSDRSHLGHAVLLGAAVSDHGAPFRSQADRALSPGCRSWPPTWAASSDPASVLFLQKRGAGPDRCAARRLHPGRLHDDRRGLHRRGAEPADARWR